MVRAGDENWIWPQEAASRRRRGTVIGLAVAGGIAAAAYVLGLGADTLQAAIELPTAADASTPVVASRGAPRIEPQPAAPVQQIAAAPAAPPPEPAAPPPEAAAPSPAEVSPPPAAAPAAEPAAPAAASPELSEPPVLTFAAGYKLRQRGRGAAMAGAAPKPAVKVRPAAGKKPRSRAASKVYDLGDGRQVRVHYGAWGRSSDAWW